MPLGALYDRFLAQGEVLTVKAAGDYMARAEQAAQSWFVPDPNGWAGGTLDLEGLTRPWDRNEIASAYMDFFDDAYGTVGDCAAAKIQSDHLAAQERAYRLRHASPIRCVAHAANRMRGHGTPGVGVFGRVTDYVQDVLVAGATGVPSGGYE